MEALQRLSDQPLALAVRILGVLVDGSGRMRASPLFLRGVIHLSFRNTLAHGDGGEGLPGALQHGIDAGHRVVAA